jgi:hypothetical protein
MTSATAGSNTGRRPSSRQHEGAVVGWKRNGDDGRRRRGGRVRRRSALVEQCGSDVVVRGRLERTSRGELENEWVERDREKISF